jgi:hypothetical protein
MIRLDVVEANDDITIDKFRFSRGEQYWCRKSKSGSKIIVEDDFGKWCAMVDLHWAKGMILLKEFEENFKVVRTVFPKNYTECKKFTDGFPL